MARDVSHQRGRVVTVFGSSRAQRDDDEYTAARRLGQLIARRGWTLCNGGHDGTMEAAARGAKDVGGATIGVSIGLYVPSNPNLWLDEEIVAESLFARLERLVTFGDGFVVLRGGIGTLLELCVVWNLAHAPSFTKPIVVVGPDWERVLDALAHDLPMWDWEVRTLARAATVDEAVECLAAHFDGVDGTSRTLKGNSRRSAARRRSSKESLDTRTGG